MRSALWIASTLTGLAFAGSALGQVASPTAETVPAAGSAVLGSVGSMDTQYSPFHNPKAAPTHTARTVYAIVGRHLVTGLSQPSGQLLLRDATNPDFLCVGRFNPARHGGPVVRLACSDGSQVNVATTKFTDGAGFARRTAASLTYGFRAEAAAQRLAAPDGYVLVADDGMLTLKRQGA